MFGNLDREQKPLLFTALCATLVCEVCVAYFAREGCKCSRFAQPAHCWVVTGSIITLPFAVHAYTGLKKNNQNSISCYSPHFNIEYIYMYSVCC